MTRFWRRMRWPVGVGIFLVVVALRPAGRGRVIDALAPFVLSIRYQVDRLSAWGETIQTIPRLADENQKLADRVREMESLAIANQQLRHENDLLRDELGIEQRGDVSRYLAAPVVSRPAAGASMLIIGKGGRDGFVPNMAVVAHGYFIGTVREVYTNTSLVDLIGSPSLVVPVVLEKSQTVGLLKAASSGLVVSEIPRDVVVSPNEAVVTAPLGSVVTAGLPVASVARVEATQSDIFQSAVLTTPVDLSRLEIVFGVK